MNAKINLFFVGIIVIVAIAGASQSAFGPHPDVVYIDGSLFSGDAKALSIIVTAVDSASATRAVESVGGQVTRALQPMGAVAAIIPADQVDALAIHPGIRAIANDNEIRAAQNAHQPEPDG